MHKKNISCKAIEPITDTAKNISANTNARFLLILPDAIGLCFFIGCILSLLKSSKSLMM